jgi:hypothetical protein
LLRKAYNETTGKQNDRPKFLLSINAGMHLIGRLIIIKMTLILKLICSISAIPIKIPMVFLQEQKISSQDVEFQGILHKQNY